LVAVERCTICDAPLDGHDAMMAMNNRNGTNEDATFMESSTDFLSSYRYALLFSVCSNRHEKQP
jgi:hypothetical protein